MWRWPRWLCCRSCEGASVAPGEGSSRRLWKAHWPVVSAPVSMGVLVGGVRRKGKLGRGWGAPTLPPLIWRVYPAECAQSHKTAHMDTGARLMERAQTQNKTCRANHTFWHGIHVTFVVQHELQRENLTALCASGRVKFICNENQVVAPPTAWS